MIHCAASTPPPSACWITGKVRLTAEPSMKARPEPSTVPTSTQARALGGWACSTTRPMTPRSQGGWSAWLIRRPSRGLGRAAVQFEGDAVRLGDEELADAAVRRLAGRVGDTGRVQPAPGVLVVVDGEGEVVQRGAARRRVLA